MSAARRASLKQRIGPILEALEGAYPNAGCSLHYADPLQLLVATILSAQCTDAIVNQVTPARARHQVLRRLRRSTKLML